MNYIIVILTGYLLGSIPTAYILLRKIRKIDITNSGSNNVGAMNSYEVSESKLIGLIVLIIDATKGALSVFLPSFIFGSIFELQMLSLVFAVFAHCYSPWLKFKGGRGLATAAGGTLLISPVIFLLWAIFWVISFLYKKHIHFSNFVASVLTAILAYTSSDIINSTDWYTNPVAETNLSFAAFNIIMLLIIISRHTGFIKDYFSKDKIKNRGSNDE